MSGSRRPRRALAVCQLYGTSCGVTRGDALEYLERYPHLLRVTTGCRARWVADECCYFGSAFAQWLATSRMEPPST